jgi:hypothetical protein
MSFSATAGAATRDDSAAEFDERVDMVDLWALGRWTVDEMYGRNNPPEGVLCHLTVSARTTIEVWNARKCV